MGQRKVGEYFAHSYIIPHIQTLKKILSWISYIKISLQKKCIFHDWRYFVIILIFAKHVSFCIKIHRLNNLLNDTNDHFKCSLEYFIFRSSLFHSFFFHFLSIPKSTQYFIVSHFQQILQIGSMTSNQYQVSIDPEKKRFGRDQTLFFLQWFPPRELLFLPYFFNYTCSLCKILYTKGCYRI